MKKRLMKIKLGFGIGLLGLTAFGSMMSKNAYSHARLKQQFALVPRKLPDGSIPDGSKPAGTDINAVVCGPNTLLPNPTADVRTLVAGQSYTLQFEETINHTGTFEIQLLPTLAPTSGRGDGLAWISLSGQFDDPSNPASRDNPAQFTRSITIPNTFSCERCTIRLVQWMAVDGSRSDPYYSCADVRVAPAGTPPSPSPPVTPTPPSEDTDSNPPPSNSNSTPADC